MITSVYIDNYKFYSNASIELSGFNLMMGQNGSGKTALFEVFDRIKRLVAQEEKSRCRVSAVDNDAMGSTIHADT